MVRQSLEVELESGIGGGSMPAADWWDFTQIHCPKLYGTEFLSLDKNGDGRLSFEEFEQAEAIRDRCSIKADEATPMHLLHLNWSKAFGGLHLDMASRRAEPQERYMRELARKFNLPLDQARLPGRILRLKKRLRQSSIGAGGDPERGCSSQHWMAVGRRLLKVLNSKKLSCWEDLIVKVPAKSRKDILQQSGVATSLLVRDFQEKNAQTSGATVLPRFWPVTIDELRQMALPLLWICLALNGFIEEAEFRNCVAVLWNCDMFRPRTTGREDIPATRFRQFWLEADKARLGKLSFEATRRAPSRLVAFEAAKQADRNWEMSEYGDFVCLQPVTNLIGTCRELRENDSCFWRRKVDFLLKAAGNFQLSLKCDQDTCVLLLTVIRLLKNALNCDWLALHDLHVVLSSTGLVRPWNMVLVMYSLLSSQSSLVMSQQALHWLWDIVTGFSKPWLCPKEPLEAKSLEPLRQWLQKFVSKEIHTWHDLTEERIYEASGSSAALRQRKERVVKLALWLILVHEFGAREEVQPSRIAAIVKTASSAGRKLKQLWAVPLLFLAEPLRRGTLELKGPGWDGLAVVKSVIQDDESTTGGGACSISFPAWTMDAAWVHSQRGLLRDGASRWVQLDARFDAASGTYWGQWVRQPSERTVDLAARRTSRTPSNPDAEEFLDQPLDVLVFSMSRCDAHFKSLVCGRKSQEVFSELFGLAGGMQGEKMLLRCFYLTKPREASDLFM
ncbi:unnamed protein product [Durusdinium trenchii]|uniref:EF-hand domain-containing protein n=1 Tax=Durusdinium trenchii TaxID=1381693 RepID=A0ABP0RZR1_9DINO